MLKDCEGTLVIGGQNWAEVSFEESEGILECNLKESGIAVSKFTLEEALHTFG